jgi:nitrogen fixation NifU-like protein
MDDLYRDYILDHYKRPRNFGELTPHDLEAHDHNPLCGDEMGVHIRVEDGKIADLRFHGQGCAISQAAASIASDEYIGMALDELPDLDGEWMIGVGAVARLAAPGLERGVRLGARCAPDGERLARPRGLFPARAKDDLSSVLDPLQQLSEFLNAHLVPSDATSAVFLSP